MKKSTNRFTYYLVCWVIFLALFNVICFVTSDEMFGMNKYGGAFWAGYVSITITFIGQLACAFFAFREENTQKFFYHVPLITISYSGTIASLVVGGVCMAVPNIPNWLGIVLCAIIFAFTAVAAVMAKAAADEITAVDQKIKEKTFFIRSLTVDAQTLVQSAKSDDIRKECEKVYEAIRYSDPMSNDALAGAEAAITLKFNEFSAAAAGGKENIGILANELVILINDRNQKCKLLK